MCSTISQTDIVDDKRFSDQRTRAVNYAELANELQTTLTTKVTVEWVELPQQGGLIAHLAHTWKQVVDTPLFAENDPALHVGSGSRRLEPSQVIHTPARYSSFNAAVTKSTIGLLASTTTCL
nr:CoA transferase [Mycobacterium leprae]